ncbi:DUF7289 family protein [Halobacterium jilantaiense]|uniref:Flagellin N-terminal-like domain-containing protein n=1 Tax=Halobacterium jilantaiense TaxID=355548 RepID=A0A1I0N597_9EURY|nr:archaellin/type IV pilin N-terminal domain-containing protein [Halobacterium jilantaiense]SEV96193.1 flagellin N-terminal-like domain-containing protein [Halobacterium jilantaiense]
MTGRGRGQSETIGLVLLLAITVLGVTSVVAFAAPALDGAEEATNAQRVEQSLSQLDSRTAVVALGRTDSQSVSLSESRSGAYAVKPDAGRISVLRLDENGSQVGTVLNTTMGEVVYERGDTRVAFQGGGVWRTSGRGAEMLSPPEFNYQDATLTLPVIRVGGESSTFAGAPLARVSGSPVTSVFPVASDSNRSNPLSGGTVVVRVDSDYYRGWEQFFRERSTGNVTVNETAGRVELELIARGSGGTYTLEETPIELRGLGDDQPIENLQFSLYPNKASSFNDLHWAMVADDGGTDRFEVELDGGNPCKGDSPTVAATYENGGTVHEWVNDTAWTEGRDSGSSFTYECSGKNDKTPELHFDLTGATNLAYQDGSSPLTNDSVGNIVNTYLAEMGPNVDLEVTSKGKNDPPGNSASTDLAASTVDVDYNSSSGRVLTFLHVTENSVNVTLT